MRIDEMTNANCFVYTPNRPRPLVGKRRTCEIRGSASEATVTYDTSVRLGFSRDSDDLDDDDDIITAAPHSYGDTNEGTNERAHSLALSHRVLAFFLQSDVDGDEGRERKGSREAERRKLPSVPCYTFE